MNKRKSKKIWVDHYNKTLRYYCKHLSKDDSVTTRYINSIRKWLKRGKKIYILNNNSHNHLHLPPVYSSLFL